MSGRHPPPLPPGARVAVTCPASPVPQDHLRRGLSRLRALGLEVVAGPSCLARGGLWAGKDAARAEELAGFLCDPAIDAIFAGRGGVGCLRLLPHLEKLPNDLPPKWLIGRSDLTALHLVFWEDRGWIGLSGPMVATDLGREEPPPHDLLASTFRLLRDPTPIGRPTRAALETWREGEAEGLLVPANLSLLASMAGTPYQPSLRGAILVLEEIGEPPRRIDRMLTQLGLARALDRLSGLVFGQFTGCSAKGTGQAPEMLREVLHDHAERIGVPTLAGFPYGHEMDFTPLPIGVRAAIRSDPPRIEILEGAAAEGDGR